MYLLVILYRNHNILLLTLLLYIFYHDFTLIMLKDVWVSKSKKVYVFLFFEHFEHMNPFLWNILNFIKKIEMIWWTFDKEKRFLKQKTTCLHAF
jgi:hypothetical protein